MDRIDAMQRARDATAAAAHITPQEMDAEIEDLRFLTSLREAEIERRGRRIQELEDTVAALRDCLRAHERIDELMEKARRVKHGMGEGSDPPPSLL